jgi:uncharacterized protein
VGDVARKLDCQACAACCYAPGRGPFVLTSTLGLPLKVVPDDVVSGRGWRCILLLGNCYTGHACQLYDSRPLGCREVLPGDPYCLGRRLACGILELEEEKDVDGIIGRVLAAATGLPKEWCDLSAIAREIRSIRTTLARLRPGVTLRQVIFGHACVLELDGKGEHLVVSVRLVEKEAT